jgi:hypothetical protein
VESELEQGGQQLVGRGAGRGEGLQKGVEAGDGGLESQVFKGLQTFLRKYVS